MVFSTLTFLTLFLPAVLGGCWILGAVLTWRARRTGRPMNWTPVNALLLLFSLVFYFWGEGLGVGWLLLSIAVNDVLARAIAAATSARRRKGLLAIDLVANLCFLGWFKYAGFLASSVNALLALGVPVPHVLLPLGISFYTFQAMSYCVDVYRREIVPTRNPVDFACYVAMFPQLVAGPIVRYVDVAAQLVSRTITLEQVASGFRRFLVGLAKKVLIANTVASMADAVWALAEQGRGIPAGLTALGVLCYALQIYYDFSGYSDMAIGLGRMLGFRFPENFLHPYCSASVREFWRRWHISLSSWFRDYLYIPLGGNRKGKVRTGVNGLAVFALCGLWHGASIMFLLWGLWHGLFLMLERVLPRRPKDAPPRPAAVRAVCRLGGHVYTVAVFLAGWVLFRSETWLGFRTIWLSLFGALEPAPEARALWLDCHRMLQTAVLVGIVLAYPVVPALRRLALRTLGPTLLTLGEWIIATALAVFSILFLTGNSYNPFLYFRF